MNLQFGSIGHNPEFCRKNFARFDTKDCQKLRLLVHSVQQTSKKYGNSSIGIENEFASASTIRFLGKLNRRSLHTACLQLMQLFSQHHHFTQKNRRINCASNWYFLSNRNDQSQSTKEQFTPELISFASAYRFPENTLRQFT